ncbi:MAG: type II toxin-antitoxin system VapB family antitoxin [Candidatus Promineifilaceae bacterium]
MALSIKNREVEILLDSIIKITGESKTEAVRKALEERQQRLVLHSTTSHDQDNLIAFLEEEIWPHIPKKLLGKPLGKSEEEEILGIGKLGT